uniref:Uncharacterized protein n=1 Tax=Steinernema glaseri TaxID=37863 RepID=A0A1I8A9S9_9BILA
MRRRLAAAAKLSPRPSVAAGRQFLFPRASQSYFCCAATAVLVIRRSIGIDAGRNHRRRCRSAANHELNTLLSKPIYKSGAAFSIAKQFRPLCMEIALSTPFLLQREEHTRSRCYGRSCGGGGVPLSVLIRSDR